MAKFNDHGRNCGCDACDRAEEAAERDAEHLDGIVAKLRADDASLHEAEEWVAGSFDSDHYAEVTLALHALARTEPADLMGSAVLANLYRLARVDHDAIEAELRRMAQDELDGRDNLFGSSAAKFLRLTEKAA